MPRVLILGGTADAVRLAERLSAQTELELIYSLAGVTRQPRLPNCRVHRGGFGGAAGLRGYIEANRVDILLDATHPFAAQINAHARDASDAAGIPCIRYRRPPWRPERGDQWLPVPDAAAAAIKVADLGERTFLTIGSKGTAAFTALNNIWFLIRTIDPPAQSLPLGQHELTLGRGPFSLEDEIDLMRQHRIAVLVTRNSGGTPVAAKITAARQLERPVVMIERPAAAGDALEDEDAVIAHMAGLV